MTKEQSKENPQSIDAWDLPDFIDEIDRKRKESESQRFQQNRSNIERYIKEARELVDNKTTPVSELEKKRYALKRLVLQLGRKHNLLEPEHPQYTAIPELEDKQKNLLEQAIAELNNLAEEYEYAINYRKLHTQAPNEARLKEPAKEKQVSYTWLNKPDTELPELYQLLIDAQLMHPATTIEQLRAVFTAKPLQGIEPIKWHDDNASELLYFILQLESTDSIAKGRQTNYQRLTACFVKPDGSPFESAFKTLKQRVNVDLSEPKQQTIRSIVNSFL